MEKIPCEACGALILPTTAQSTGGLCMPCKKARRLREDDLYSGGDGASVETAIVINTVNPSLGVEAEYVYIGKQCGIRQVDWELELQRLQHYAGKPYDVLNIRLCTGAVRTFYFDLSTFYAR
jgi:hypothetical protein